MSKYRKLVRDMIRKFEQVSLVKVLGEENSRADELDKAASGCAGTTTVTKIEILEGPSIEDNTPH